MSRHDDDGRDLIRGGQGRSAEELAGAAETLSCLLGLLLAGGGAYLVLWTAWRLLGPAE